MTPSHCTAHHKCWECFQGWQARALERDIALAASLVKLRVAILVNSAESISSLRHATHLLQQLHNRQWREMVRDPFLFDSPLKKALEKNTLTIEDLDLDL